MRFGKDTRNKGPYLAVFDVGATSIGLGIACEEEGITTILWSIRTEYSYQAYDDYTRYERAMYSTLLDAGMKLMSEGVRSVRATNSDFKPEHMSVVCVLEAPWSWSGIGRAEIVKEKPFSVTDEVLTGLEEEARSELVSGNESRSWHDVVGESHLLTQDRQRLELNGYLVSSIHKEPVLSVAVHTYFSLIGVTVHKQITQIIERILPHHDITLTPSTHLLATHYRTTVGAGTGHRIFLVEAEGRITSVASITGGTLSRVGTIPLGTNHILSAAAPDALSTEEARGKLLVAYKSHDADPDMPLPDSIQEACTAWRSALLDEFKKHSAGVVPPEHVLLMAGRRWNTILIPLLEQPWVVPGLRKERTLKVTPALELIAQPKKKSDDSSAASKPVKPFDSRIQLFSHALFYSHRA